MAARAWPAMSRAESVLGYRAQDRAAHAGTGAARRFICRRDSRSNWSPPNRKSASRSTWQFDAQGPPLDHAIARISVSRAGRQTGARRHQDSFRLRRPWPRRKITTFADGLNIPIGIYPYKDGAIGYSIPYIYRFQDTNHDGRADIKEQFLGRFGFEKDTHGMTSSFRRGYDGWLYANHGFNNDFASSRPKTAAASRCIPATPTA